MSDLLPELLAKRQELEELRRRDELVKQSGISCYEPHKKQDLFHQAGRFKLRYVRTGNRFGKSTMGAAEDVAWALGYRPWYPEGHPARYEGIPQRPIKLLIVVIDWKKADAVFTNQTEGAERGKLFKLLPRDKVLGTENEQSGWCSKIEVESKWGGVSTIHVDTIQSFKKSKLSFESEDWDAIHIDEPCPEALWVAASRGLIDRDGSAWFTCTPLMEPWINDFFLPEAETTLIHEQPFIQESEDGVIQKWMIDGSTHDNDRLTDVAIKRFEATISEDERETRINGRPANLVGLVYKEFKRDVHVRYDGPPIGWRSWLIPPYDYTVRLAIDTHTARPQTVLFVATSPGGYHFWFAELFTKVLVEPLKELIWQILGDHWPARCLLELAAFNENPVDGIRLSDALSMDPNRLPVEKATKDLTFGILKVKEELSRRDERGNPFHIFSPFLSETLREFDRYIMDPEKGKPVDRDDHMMECMYRLMLTGLDYIAPESYAVPIVRPLNIANPTIDVLPPLKSLLAPIDQSRKERKLSRYSQDKPFMRKEHFDSITALIADHGRQNH